MNLLRKKIDKQSLFPEYVKIINGVLSLSKREAEVLSLLFNNLKRKEILEKLHISAANLSRYLKVLKDRGLVIRGDTGKWVINDNIRPIVVSVTNKDKTISEVVELKFLLEFDDVKTGLSNTGLSSKVQERS
jgi:DNA-binding MarR family transcriptional regulator